MFLNERSTHMVYAEDNYFITSNSILNYSIDWRSSLIGIVLLKFFLVLYIFLYNHCSTMLYTVYSFPYCIFIEVHGLWSLVRTGAFSIVYFRTSILINKTTPGKGLGMGSLNLMLRTKILKLLYFP